VATKRHQGIHAHPSIYRYFTADVFTDQLFGGNQLAVFPDAGGLTDAQMLAITREFNFSETTFVFPADWDDHTRKLRIFTPGGEVPFAGHPTVGTAHVLFAGSVLMAYQEDMSVIFEEGVGPVPVTVRFSPRAFDGGTIADGEPIFAQLTVAKLPEVGEPAPPLKALAQVLSLTEDDFVGGTWTPEPVSCGLPFMIVPLKTRDAVRRARIRMDAWEPLLRGKWGSEIMVFTLEPEAPTDAAPDGDAPRPADVRARVFVPGLNVPEDPATGSACAALAGYLAARDPRTDGTLHWSVQQGVEMGRPSRLELEVDRKAGRTTAVRVGGSSVLVSEGTMRVA
jgi:trans-2,3-dihydro-3-hydroxyanthranilate isomerase